MWPSGGKGKTSCVNSKAGGKSVRVHGRGTAWRRDLKGSCGPTTVPVSSVILAILQAKEVSIQWTNSLVVWCGTELWIYLA